MSRSNDLTKEEFEAMNLPKKVQTPQDLYEMKLKAIQNLTDHELLRLWNSFTFPKCGDDLYVILDEVRTRMFEHGKPKPVLATEAQLTELQVTLADVMKTWQTLKSNPVPGLADGLMDRLYGAWAK